MKALLINCVCICLQIVIYIGEICRYLLAQPDRPSDTKHCVRITFGNGLRAQIWEKFRNRFNIPIIREFYAATEGNASGMNITGKVGSSSRTPFLITIIPDVNWSHIDQT